MASRSASGSRMSDTDDIISGGSSVGENNWQEQQQYLIEEEIEEVTEYDELDETKSEVVDRTDESSKRKVITTKTSKPKTILSTPDPAIRGDIDCVLAEISHEVKEDEKVPFPEFGVDIVFRKVDEEVSDCSSDESSSSCSASDGGSFDDEPRREKHKTSSHQDLNNIEESGLNSVITCNMRTNEWEDNWLFRRKKTSEIPPASLRDLSVLDSTEFVAMLVPNPMDGQEWKAKIGQEDIDQVSEMSERNSEASLDLASMISVSSSDDDEERFNSLEEGQQKDLEHTEYSVLPLRRDSRCFDHLYDSIGSVGQSGDLEFRLSPENASVQAENNVTFTCIVEGTKPIDVAWFHGATLLNDTGGRVALLRRRNVFNLTIFNAHQSDAGVYACMAVNPIGEKCKHFSLEVKESSGPHASPRMPSVEFEFGDPLEACEEFSQVDLNFKVKGHPEPRLIFVKNNCRLQPNENVDIVRNGPFSWTLKLLRCQPRDGGSYTVRAINSIGSTQRKWNVQIKVKERQRNKWITKQTSEKQIEKRKDIYDQLLKANQSKENTGSQSAKTSQAINMPLYPHSILKKPKAVEPAPVVPELPSSVEPIDVDADIFDRPAAQPGTIADREHRKWTEQAIRLQNNPYSRESIERRLLRGTSSDNLSPTRLTRDSDNSGNRDGFKIPNGESSPSSSDDGKEQITISGADRTRRIDCGPKSSNVSRYRRDYYVQSSGGNDYDVIYPDSNKRQFKTSDASSAQGEIVERTKAMLFSRLSVEEDESAKVWRKNESSHKEPSEKQTEEEKVEPEPAQPKTERGRSVSMERRSEEEESSDSERLPDSLDDQGVPDSGVGSSSEKTSTMSKVEAEILRFQREIERASQEKTRQQEWERRKLSRISSSMDSLLSADELPTPSRAPALPPKGKFVSTGNLLPPALPPKQRNLGMTPKRVSISTDEVRIIGIGGYSDESDDDDFYEGEEEEYDSCPSTSSSRQIDPATYCQPPPPPDVVPQQFSRQNSVSQDEKDEAKPAQQVQAPQLVLNKKEKINDIPSKLPSVKELANKFLVKKSPEPMPRKSVKKVDSPLVKEQNPFLFKQSNSSREIPNRVCNTSDSLPAHVTLHYLENSSSNLTFDTEIQTFDKLPSGEVNSHFSDNNGPELTYNSSNYKMESAEDNSDMEDIYKRQIKSLNTLSDVPLHEENSEIKIKRLCDLLDAIYKAENSNSNSDVSSIVLQEKINDILPTLMIGAKRDNKYQDYSEYSNCDKKSKDTETDNQLMDTYSIGQIDSNSNLYEAPSSPQKYHTNQSQLVKTTRNNQNMSQVSGKTTINCQKSLKQRSQIPKSFYQQPEIPNKNTNSFEILVKTEIKHEGDLLSPIPITRHGKTNSPQSKFQPETYNFQRKSPDSPIIVHFGNVKQDFDKNIKKKFNLASHLKTKPIKVGQAKSHYGLQRINEHTKSFQNEENQNLHVRQEPIPAKLTAGGISVSYSAPPLPPTPSPTRSLPSPSQRNRRKYLDWSLYEDRPSTTSPTSVPISWSSTSFTDNILTPSSGGASSAEYKSPKGKIDLDSRLDFSPQIIQDDQERDYSTSPTYSVLYDDEGNCIAFARPCIATSSNNYSTSSPLSQGCDHVNCDCNYDEEDYEDDYPSSWEHNENESSSSNHIDASAKTISDCISDDEIPRSILIPSAWSDIGVTLHSSVDLFRRIDRFRPPKSAKMVYNMERKSKSASDSNIQDALIMMEPGLRRIRKDSYTTSTTMNSSCENYKDTLEVEEDVYQCIECQDQYEGYLCKCYQTLGTETPNEESGFFSYPWQNQGQSNSWTPPHQKDQGKGLQKLNRSDAFMFKQNKRETENSSEYESILDQHSTRHSSVKLTNQSKHLSQAKSFEIQSQCSFVSEDNLDFHEPHAETCSYGMQSNASKSSDFQDQISLSQDNDNVISILIIPADDGLYDSSVSVTVKGRQVKSDTDANLRCSPVANPRRIKVNETSAPIEKPNQQTDVSLTFFLVAWT